MADSCENGNEPSISVKGWKLLTICASRSFSRRTLLHAVGLSYLHVW